MLLKSKRVLQSDRGCRRCVILLFVSITIMQSSEQHVLEYFFGRTVG